MTFNDKTQLPSLIFSTIYSSVFATSVTIEDIKVIFSCFYEEDIEEALNYLVDKELIENRWDRDTGEERYYSCLSEWHSKLY